MGAAVNVKSIAAAAGPRLDESTPAMGGVMIATCCHHRCTWETYVKQPLIGRLPSLHLRSSPFISLCACRYVNQPFFESLGIGEDDFALVALLSSWATSATSVNEARRPPVNEALRPPVNDSKRPRHETSQSPVNEAPRPAVNEAWPRHETLQSQCVEASTATLRSQEDGAFNSQEGVRSQSPGVETVAGAARGPSELDEEHSARPSVRPSELDEEHSVADPEALAQLGMRLHRLDAARRAELGRMCEPLPDTRWLRDDPLMTT